jgi:hypothetical protein
VNIDGDGDIMVAKPLSIDTNMSRGYEARSRLPLDISIGILASRETYTLIFNRMGTSMINIETLGRISITALVGLIAT